MTVGGWCSVHPFVVSFIIYVQGMSPSFLLGSLIGGHQETATFVPDVYSRTQDEWVSAFYSQNGYFDYSTMSRLGEFVARKKIQNFN